MQLSSLPSESEFMCSDEQPSLWGLEVHGRESAPGEGASGPSRSYIQWILKHHAMPASLLAGFSTAWTLENVPI